MLNILKIVEISNKFLIIAYNRRLYLIQDCLILIFRHFQDIAFDKIIL